VRPASISRSVCRHRNAGICRISATSAAGPACEGSWISVSTARPAAFTPARIRSPSAKPGPRYDETLVRLALSEDALHTNGPAIFAMASAMRSTCSSLSITQGPAISASGLAPPNRIEGVTSISTCVLDVPQQRPGQAPLAILVRRPDEGPEQRMRLERLRLELRMELAAQKPPMAGNLADLEIGKTAVREQR